jgi:FKBP-type peptidyl-prolyl cis-trans isomerase (trigger factor)
VTIELVIHSIGTKEKITPDAEKVEKEIGAVLERYSDADPQRARVYVESLLASDAVFAFLESQGK